MIQRRVTELRAVFYEPLGMFEQHCTTKRAVKIACHLKRASIIWVSKFRTIKTSIVRDCRY